MGELTSPANVRSPTLPYSEYYIINVYKIKMNVKEEQKKNLILL
jgi:hypothetical protein